MYSLFWSNNIIKSEAPISTFLKNKLTEDAEIIKKLVECKYLKRVQEVIEFEVIFTYNAK